MIQSQPWEGKRVVARNCGTLSCGGYASDSIPEMEIIMNVQKNAFTKRYIEVFFCQVIFEDFVNTALYVESF